MIALGANSELSRRSFLLRSAALGGALLSATSMPASARIAIAQWQNLSSRLSGYVGPKFAPGLVALAALGADVETVVLGKIALDGPPMQRDTIFRIASMTKPITAAAVMMLVEDGMLKLDEPVDRLLPELANRKVLRRMDAELDDTEVSKRPITVEDLLTFRCGWGMVPALLGKETPFQKRVAELGIVGFGPPAPDMPLNSDEWVQKLAELPLIAQPGEAWLYTTGSNIQGVLVERASSQKFSDFLRKRIFEPLGMKDTAFWVPPDKIERLADAYQEKDGKLAIFDSAKTGGWSKQPMFEAGDSGLVSTADDYLAFCRMLLSGGQYNGKALLSPASVKEMTTNHLTDKQRAEGAPILAPGRGWGYGMSIVVDQTKGGPTPGSFGWNGGFGTSNINDPANNLALILLTQHVFQSPDGDPIHAEFQAAAYQAIK
jgi:CubicO group peptidase (beta-lactamase class C family)